MPLRQTVPSQRTSDRVVTSIPKKVDSLYPFHQQLLAEFLYNYVPDMDKVAWGRASTAKDERSWLMLLPEVADVTTALEMSILALSSAKLGRLNDNMQLVIESRKLYGHSLRELQKALWDPKLMYKDETLAACLMLMMYEIMECPADSRKGWITHSNGCLRLIQVRGPEAHKSGFGHQLFLSCRWNAVCRSISNHC
jgi:hypothetical protein